MHALFLIGCFKTEFFKFGIFGDQFLIIHAVIVLWPHGLFIVFIGTDDMDISAFAVFQPFDLKDAARQSDIICHFLIIFHIFMI